MCFRHKSQPEAASLRLKPGVDIKFEIRIELTAMQYMLYFTNNVPSGVMTASDMEALFKPAPFGDTGYESPLSRITEHNNLPIWDLFRNIDEDRQNNTLHVSSLNPKCLP